MPKNIDETVVSEAEDYANQALSILHSLQANMEIYGSNSQTSGASPANVEFAIKCIGRSLEYFPDNSKYLNTKALLLSEGMGDVAQAIALLTKAAEIDPRDLNIENNLNILRDIMSAAPDEVAVSTSNISEAEEYALQAEFVLNELQANLEVYGSNSVFSGANPANVDLALEYINRSLEYVPNSPAYLNIKALLLAEGKGQKKQAVEILKIAAELNPRDINIANNLKAFSKRGLFW